jgi:hypothetical protein
VPEGLGASVLNREIAISGDQSFSISNIYPHLDCPSIASTPTMADTTQALTAYKARRAQLVANSRLSLPTPIRITLATASSFVLGLGLGLSHGSKTAGLRFRAENAHRLPQTPTGWYLYHKSKNYHMALGGVKEGLKMGVRISAWVAAFFYIEDCWDEVRGEKDFLNTVVAGLSVAGGFSLWSMLFLDRV